MTDRVLTPREVEILLLLPMSATPHERKTLCASHERLRAELDTERMRLAACGVVALSNTPETATKAREMHADYRSASCDDVARAVDREMRFRAERDLLRAEVKAWRAFDEATEDEGLAFVHAPLYDAATKARAAVDAFDKEG